MINFLSFAFFLIIFSPIIAFLVEFTVSNIAYKKSTYYNTTKIPFFALRADKGKYGEYLIYKHLKAYEEVGAKFLFNVYIPKENGETSEIDVLMICSKGIFVFESKNYSGWIFGSENQKNWYQTLPQGRGRSRKEHFYNPIMQNKTHIKHLQAFLNREIPMHSVITFSDRCTLKSLNINSEKIHVIHRSSVKNVIEKINSQQESILTQNHITELYDKLFPCTQVDMQTKIKHIENIRHEAIPVIINQQRNAVETDKKEDLSETINTDDSIPENKDISVQPEATPELLCPKCNNVLLLRTASRGANAGKQFYGCSNFPKCRYIQSVE